MFLCALCGLKTLSSRRFTRIKSTPMKTVLFWFVLATSLWFTLSITQADEPVTAASIQSQITSTNTSIVAVPVPADKAVRRYHATVAVGIASIIWSLFVPAVFLFTGWSARIRSWAARRRQNWYFTFVLYALAFGLLYFL